MLYPRMLSVGWSQTPTVPAVVVVVVRSDWSGGQEDISIRVGCHVRAGEAGDDRREH